MLPATWSQPGSGAAVFVHWPNGSTCGWRDVADEPVLCRFGSALLLTLSVRVACMAQLAHVDNVLWYLPRHILRRQLPATSVILETGAMNPASV